MNCLATQTHTSAARNRSLKQRAAAQCAGIYGESH